MMFAQVCRRNSHTLTTRGDAERACQTYRGNLAISRCGTMLEYFLTVLSYCGQFCRCQIVALTTRFVVLPIVHRKAYAMLVMLLVCITATMLIECQVHTAVFTHGHATPAGHHHSHATSGYMAGAVPCLLAVLPIGGSLIIFVYFRFHITLLVLYYAALAFPLFIPPRNAAAT